MLPRIVAVGQAASIWRVFKIYPFDDPEIRNPYIGPNLHRGFQREFRLESDGRLTYSAAVVPKLVTKSPEGKDVWWISSTAGIRHEVNRSLTGDFFVGFNRAWGSALNYLAFC